MTNKSINDITLFRYLFNLDNRDLPQSILNWYESNGNEIPYERDNAIRELANIKGNCRDLVVFSKSFIQLLDESFMEFTHLHRDVLAELDDENGIVRSPYFVDGCYVVYRIKSGCLTLWVVHDSIDKHLSIPTYYICASAKDKIKGDGHQLDIMMIPLLDNCVEEGLQDYIDMVLNYLCLRQQGNIHFLKRTTTIKREVKKNNKIKITTDAGLDYYLIDD